jgi:glutathione synthase/RimK-type ligase-like ATP-grasp enzyme
MIDLLLPYEHPSWFTPLFAALERRGVDYRAVDVTDHGFDPGDLTRPARVVLSRVAMSGFLREAEHPIFYAAALMDHYARAGAVVLNGADVLAIDSSKARQLSLVRSLGFAVPETRIVHRTADVLAAAQSMAFPLLVKANIGGSGAGITRFASHDELAVAVAQGMLPSSIDRVLMVQDYVPPREGTIVRMETLEGRFLYALEVESSGTEFDLCPADACLAQPGRSALAMRAVDPAPELIAIAEQVAQAAGMFVGGIELVIDDRDGVARVYDINALSNFVADPLRVLGYDPHERLVDAIERRIAAAGE